MMMNINSKYICLIKYLNKLLNLKAIKFFFINYMETKLCKLIIFNKIKETLKK